MRAFGTAQLVEEEQGSFFKATFDRSLEAAAKAGAIERYVSIAGSVICLRFAGEALVASFTRALAHLVVPPATHPDAVFHIWDSKSTGVAMVSPPCPPACFTSRGDIWTMGSQRFKSAYLWSENALNLFDTRSANGIYWTQGTAPLPYWAKASPLRCLLHWWAETKGYQLLHAAAVGNNDGAMLITGKGGLGKSTAALACLEKGLKYLGDDYVLVSLDPVAQVHSLYCTAKLNWEQAGRFPRLSELIEGSGIAGAEKAVFHLHPTLREQITASLPLRLVATPRIAGRPDTQPETISRSALGQAASFTTLAQLPRAGARTYDFINRLVGCLPGVQLALGQDFGAIAETVVRLLQNPVLQNVSGAEMTTPVPLLSIIVPVRNAASLLQETVASVLAQGHQAIEIIVVDDGSTDDVAAAVAALPVDVRLLKQGHRGPAAARNRGIRECSGDLITFIDAGNVWPERALSVMLDLLASDRNCDIVRGSGRRMAAAGQTSQQQPNSATLAGAIYRRAVFEKSGLFDWTSPFGEDNAWFNRARGLGLKLRELAHATLLIRAPDAAQASEASPLEANALRALKDALNRQRSAGGLVG